MAVLWSHPEAVQLPSFFEPLRLQYFSHFLTVSALLESWVCQHTAVQSWVEKPGGSWTATSNTAGLLFFHFSPSISSLQEKNPHLHALSPKVEQTATHPITLLQNKMWVMWTFAQLYLWIWSLQKAKWIPIVPWIHLWVCRLAEHALQLWSNTRVNKPLPPQTHPFTYFRCSAFCLPALRLRSPNVSNLLKLPSHLTAAAKLNLISSPPFVLGKLVWGWAIIGNGWEEKTGEKWHHVREKENPEGGQGHFWHLSYLA